MTTIDEMKRRATISKITRPVFSAICLRKRLFSRLDKGRKSPVIWISGQPGAGKTILASSYLEARGLECVWYQVDTGDADPATFFYYMREAALSVAPGRKKPIPLFTPEYAHGMSVFSRRFFEELFLRMRPGSCLVIDNFQEAASSPLFRAAVIEGLASLSPGMNAIIISRGAPPPEMAKLIAAGSVEMIGPDELAISREEAGLMARLKLGGKALKNTEDLIQRANGWAAGLAIMLEEERLGLGAAAGDVKGRLFDYFASEIFNRMDERARSLLLKTSVLSEFDAATAGRVAGIKDAGAVLSELNRENYFIERRLLSRPVYQYHPLFREFLLEHLQTAYGADAINQLKKRAAVVLSELGRREEAVELLEAAGDWDSLARILAPFAPELMAQGRHGLLRQWLGSIPESKLHGEPWLLFWCGASALPADPVEARRRLTAAYRLFKGLEDPAGLYLSWSAIADTFFYEWKDFRPLDAWIMELGRLREKYRKCPSEEIEERVVSSMFGALVFRQPEAPQLPKWEERVREILFKAKESPSKILIGNNLIFYYLWTGRYAKARVVIDSFSGGFEQKAPDLPLIMWCIVNALYNFHVSNFDEALAWVDRGLEASDSSGIHILKSKLYGLGSFSSSIGPVDIKKAEAYSSGMSSSLNRENCFDLTYYHQQASRIALAKGDTCGAIENIRVASDYAERLGAPFLKGMAETIFSYYLIEDNERAEARRRINNFGRLGRETGSLLFEYIRLMTEAHYYLCEGREKECLESLSAALSIGKKNGLRYLNVNLPTSSARLLAIAVKAGIEPDFTAELIKSNRLACPDPALERWPWRLKVRSFGAFEVWSEGEKIRFTRKAQQKPFDLLKALITLGGRHVSEQRITDMLWPEAEGDAAHSAFATTLHRLRQLIGSDRALELKDGKLSLDSRDSWVDLWAFEAALKRAEGELKSGCLEDALNGLDTALELYRGDFLATDSDVSWTVQVRDKSRERVLKLIGDAAHRLISDAKPGKAAEYLDLGLSIDDCNEGFCRKLLDIYRTSGKKREAVTLFERLERALSERLNAEPSAATKALMEAFLKNDSNL